MSRIITNLSVSPYWDDYDPSKQYYKILFVPKRAVQVREAVQLQTMVQEQISRFGDHVFKDGSIVSGCNITYIPRFPYVRCSVFNNNNANSNFTTDVLKDFLVVSPETGLRASISIANPGFLGTYPATNIMYVDYINTGYDSGNNVVQTFQSAETLEIYSPSQDKFGNLNPGLLYNTINVFTANTLANTVSTGQAYGITVGDGVVYQKGYFVATQKQTTLVAPYDTEVNGKLVGFETQESIVTYLQDTSLIDPVDTSNRNGIGADRLKLTPVLVVKERDSITDADDFFPIAEFGANSKPIKQNTDPAYAALGDKMAGEKFEESGDFYVKPFIVSTQEAANTQNFYYNIDAGIAYVKGNRVQLLNSISIEKPRGIEEGFSNANITTLNYGNYVLVNEVVGTFNADRLISVDIYDTLQTAITSTRSPNSPTGTKIGTANVRAVVFDNGTKGSPQAVYKLYITNISMNSGKSFLNDAKSFVISSANNGLGFGAIADIQLVANNAVIRDSGTSGLIFGTGIVGTKRLKDPSGVNDTSFTFRDTSTATLQANGSVTFTLNTPYAGGAERFFSSPGILSAVNKLKIDVSTTSAFTSGNLPGTVNGSTGNTTVLGTTTAFLTSFRPGEFIRINSVNYRIENIASNTNMTVNANVTGGNATQTYQKVAIAGGLLDLTNSTVTAVSNTQFILDLGYSIGTGDPQTLVATYPVVRNQAYEMKKEVKRDNFVKIDCSANTSGPFNLGVVDVFSISSVYVGTTYSENNPDRKGWFILDNGQQPTHYDHARLILKPEYQGKLTSATRILVKLNNFTANTATGIGFFSADSYPVQAPGAVANSTNISYEDIPEAFGYNLRDAIDFRPQKFNTATLTTDANTASINPAIANSSFNVGVAGAFIGEPDSNFSADVEFYLPRIDIIQVNKDGIFSVKSSVGGQKPISPIVDNDAMSLAVAKVPPFPGVTADLIQNYAITKPRIKTTLSSIRGYTMKDINALDKRITILEYYQTLSMLEQQAKDYTVRDENGLDRFKNGIFADPLKNHLLGDVNNFEYYVAIDEKNQIARPPINKHSVDLNVANTVNAAVNGRVASLDYIRELYTSQPYASKFRNVTESVWRWTGSLQLFPEYDSYQDETALPAVNVEIDLASPWEEFANSPFAQQFGDWRVASTQVESNTSGSARTGTTTVSTTTTSSQRDTTTLNVGTSQSTHDLGSYVTDISLNPYMRSRLVAFVASGLRPNTQFYPFFADSNVGEHCAPGTLNLSIYNQATGELLIDTGKEDEVISRTGNFGDPLIADAEGNVYGVFRIPAQKFRVGERQFRLLDIDDLIVGADAILSSAHATYTASSLTTSTRNLSITTTNPTISSTVTTETRVESATTITRRPARVQQQREINRGGSGDGDSDPLGQTIYVDAPTWVPGRFMEAIGVYFRSKDETLGITCYLTEMIAGVPDASKVLASAYLKPNNINVSNDSSAETIFKFNDIPYLTKDRYYAFFLRPDGDSPNYTTWMAEIGGVDILTGVKIFSNPYIGNAVRSANSNTWDPLITEDIKFNAYTCNFPNLTGSVEFVEQDDDFFSVDGFTFANTNTTIQVGDVVYSAHPNNVVITGNNAPFGLVQSYDQIADQLALDSSTGGFTANTRIHIYRPPVPNNPASISANNLIATSIITSVDNLDYSIVVPRIATTTPTGTSIAFSYMGTDVNGIADVDWKQVQPETELEMPDIVRTIRSKSNRVGNATTSRIKIDLASTSNLISPIIDLRRRNMFAIDNIINNDLTNEETRHGNARVRHLTKIIELNEGQDAEDILPLLTAYRPAGTEITVYGKFLSADDPDGFYDKLWTKLDMTQGNSVYSSTVNTNDFREYGFSVPTTEQMQGTAWLEDGILQYRNAAGTIFVGYKQFALKTVFTSTQKQRVPRLDDIRALCLQR